MCAIELNDKSHLRADRAARDTFLASAMSSAGIALHFVPAKGRYSTDDLKYKYSRARLYNTHKTVKVRRQLTEM